MSPSVPFPLLCMELTGHQYSRRSLLHNPVYQTPLIAATPSPKTTPADLTGPYSGTNVFNANVVLVLSVLLCALVCSLGLNSIIKCAIRCSIFRSTSESNHTESSAQLANKGIKKKALKTFAAVSYSAELKLPNLDTECVICLSEFTLGEKVRLLPKCQHGFHIKCIDKWLNSHSSCPTCRHCLIETCQKIVSCDQAGSSQPEPEPQLQLQPQTRQAAIINIGSLEREDIVRCYRNNS